MKWEFCHICWEGEDSSLKARWVVVCCLPERGAVSHSWSGNRRLMLVWSTRGYHIAPVQRHVLGLQLGREMNWGCAWGYCWCCGSCCDCCNCCSLFDCKGSSGTTGPKETDFSIKDTFLSRSSSSSWTFVLLLFFTDELADSDAEGRTSKSSTALPSDPTEAVLFLPFLIVSYSHRLVVLNVGRAGVALVAFDFAALTQEPDRRASHLMNIHAHRTTELRNTHSIQLCRTCVATVPIGMSQNR